MWFHNGHAERGRRHDRNRKQRQRSVGREHRSSKQLEREQRGIVERGRIERIVRPEWHRVVERIFRFVRDRVVQLLERRFRTDGARDWGQLRLG